MRQAQIGRLDMHGNGEAEMMGQTQQEMMNHFDLFVRYVKMTQTYSDDRIMSYQDDENVFTLIAGGRADFTLDNVKYSVAEGDIILMFPMLPHTIEITSKEPLIEYIFHFDLYRRNAQDRPQHILVSSVIGQQSDRNYRKSSLHARVICHEELALTQYPRVIHLDKQTFVNMKSWFINMQMEFTIRQCGYELMMQSCAHRMLITALRTGLQQPLMGKSEQHHNMVPVIQAVIRFIDIHYMKKGLTVEHVAKDVGYSSNYLNGMFKRIVGMSLYQYIGYIRIENSKYLLTLGEKISMVADRTGFSSVYVYHRAFKRYTGMTPMQYMESIQIKR